MRGLVKNGSCKNGLGEENDIDTKTNTHSERERQRVGTEVRENYVGQLLLRG